MTWVLIFWVSSGLGAPMHQPVQQPFGTEAACKAALATFQTGPHPIRNAWCFDLGVKR